MKWLLSPPAIMAVLCAVTLPSQAQLPIPTQPETPQIPLLMAPVFEAGKTYRFISNTTVYLAPQSESPRQIIMEQQARYDADPRTGGQKGVALRGLTERLRVNIQNGADTVVYDSLSKGHRETPIGRHFESTVNRYVRMELNQKMKVVSQKQAGRTAGSTPLPDLPRFGPEELVQIINSIPQGYPPKKVMPWDDWVQTGKQPVGELGELEFEINYKYLGMMEHEDHLCAVIEFSGQMTGDITDDTSRNMNFRDAVITGNILYDPEIKMIRHSEHNVSMTTNIPGEKEGERRPVPMQQKTVLKLMQVVDKKG